MQEKRLVALTVLAAALLVLPPTLAAEEPGSWLLGVDSSQGFADLDISHPVSPGVGYFLSPRLRLDTALWLGYSEAGRDRLVLFPGLRYYHRTAPGKLRLNSGLALGVEIYDREGLPLPDHLDERFTLRLIPIEMEYWGFERGAVTLGLDYWSRIMESGDFESGGLGFTAGLRFRIK